MAVGSDAFWDQERRLGTRVMDKGGGGSRASRGGLAS